MILYKLLVTLLNMASYDTRKLTCAGHRCKESGRTQLTRHAMHVKDRYANVTFIDKLTKWHHMSYIKIVGFC